MLRREDVPILRADDDLVEAFEKLGASDVRRALVLDGDHLVGLLSITDLVRALEVGAPSRRRRTR